jgi:hypothetical protein
MAGRNETRSAAPRGAIEDLAREIYVRLMTGPQRHGRTLTQLAIDARDGAAAFYGPEPEPAASAAAA